MLEKELRKLRLLNKYTQKEVAEVLNIDRSTYTYYESGKTKPDLTQLAKLARLYNVSIDRILGIFTAADKICDGNAINPQYFEGCAKRISTLSDDEKRLVLLYRSCEDKNAVLSIVKEYAVSESQNDEE